MLKYFKLSLVVFLALFSIASYDAKKILSEERKSPNWSINKADFKEGYLKAVIVRNKKRKTRYCSTLIRLTSNGELLDPINLENKYRRLSNNSLIWLKYTPSRMRNRCSQARPVTIVDIKKR